MKIKRTYKHVQSRHVQYLLVVSFINTVLLLWITSQSALAKNYPVEVIDHLKEGSKRLKDNHWDAARQEFRAALEFEPHCPEAYNDIGVSYLREGNHEMAADAFRKALDLDPLFLKSLNNLGLVMYKKEQFPEAILYYRQALKLVHDNDHELHVNLANVLRDTGEFQQAQHHYAQAIKIKADYAPAYNGMAQAYYSQRLYNQAERAVKKAIELKPDYALAYYHLGLIKTAKKEDNLALSAYHQSLKYETDANYKEDTLRRIAVLTRYKVRSEAIDRANDFLKHRKWREAERVLKEALKNNPHNAALWNNLGLALAHPDQGNSKATEFYRNAIKAYEKAISLKKGGFPTAQYNLGQVLKCLGEETAAQEAFKRAIADAELAHTTYPLAQNALGISLKKQGHFKEADEAYKKAITQSGARLPVTHFNRAILLEKMDKMSEARREYMAYLSLAPNGLNAKQARARLKRLSVGF